MSYRRPGRVNPNAENSDAADELDKRLKKRVARAKALWLSRVMYCEDLSSSAKVFAYIVSDCLNCVTLDAWPGQLRCAKQLGKCSKTIGRWATELEIASFIQIRCVLYSRKSRYAPVFNAEEDKIIRGSGHNCPTEAVKNVPQSSLETSLISSPTQIGALSRADRGSQYIQIVDGQYRPNRRGELEVIIAQRLGRDGIDLLSILNDIDPQLVERLCIEQHYGRLGAEEVLAAKLAAQQAPPSLAERKRRLSQAKAPT
jgi:hypothetical protein